MDADRQIQSFGGAVDRPVDTAAERQLAHLPHQHLHEARIGGDALDLLRGEFGAVHRHHDGRAQAVILRQPLGGEPVVDRAAHRGGQVLAEDRRRAVQDVADRVACAERIESL